jgi:cation transport ATPase
MTRVTAQNNSPGNSPQMLSEGIKSSQLMPGDLIEVLPGMIFPCDCILLTGQAVINEVRQNSVSGQHSSALRNYGNTLYFGACSLCRK